MMQTEVFILKFHTLISTHGSFYTRIFLTCGNHRTGSAGDALPYGDMNHLRQRDIHGILYRYYAYMIYILEICIFYFIIPAVSS